MIETTALHPYFGLEVFDLDLTEVVNDGQILRLAQIRQMFETHSLLLFRRQNLDDAAHLRLAQWFGPIENRDKGAWNTTPKQAGILSNVDEKLGLLEESHHHVKNLKSNQLWHTDSTFLPVPALANILTARVLPSTGGETQFVSTRQDWSLLSESQKKALRNTFFWHRYSHSRGKIDKELATQEKFQMWEDQCWRAVWKNPVNQQEAIYLASHIFKVEGMPQDEGCQWVDELTDLATQSAHIYTHKWRVGDVLIWDERATMHRGCPWPYDEQRTLASLCVSASESDGLARIFHEGGPV